MRLLGGNIVSLGGGGGQSPWFLVFKGCYFDLCGAKVVSYSKPSAGQNHLSLNSRELPGQWSVSSVASAIVL